MAKFGTSKFGTFNFGVTAEGKFRAAICYDGIPLGIQIRRQLNKQWIFRIYQGVQEKYAYFVPANPQTVDQQAWRAKFTAGIAAAKLLSPEEKAAYKTIACRKPGQTWHSVFMSKYLWAESH